MVDLGLTEAGPKAIAGICGSLAIMISLYQIMCHLRNYTGPIFQRYIVRLIFMIPVYSVSSFLSFINPGNAIWYDSVRDCYEAWVIYNFLSLCLAYVGGPGAVEVKMNGYVLMPSWTYSTCCLPPLLVNGRFVRMCKRGTLQFVLLKPVMAVLTLVLYSQGKYEENWSANNGYLWITIVYNVTYTLALYALLLFYLGTHDLLAPFKPMLKFLVVKSIVFMTFWQSLFIVILTSSGALATTDDNGNTTNEGTQLQELLICLEMLPASIAMLWAFNYKDYKGTGPHTGLDVHNVTHAISVRDLVSDTVHQFAPTYHDYVLYSNSGAKSAPKTQRAKAIPLPKGVELQQAGYNFRDNANLLANMELGVHREDYERETTDLDKDSEGTPGAQGTTQAHTTTDLDTDLEGVPEAAEPGMAAYREPRYTDQDDDVFQERAPPKDDDDEGIEYYSADVNARRTTSDDVDGEGKKKKHKNRVLRRTTTDDLAPGDTSLQMEDDAPQPPKSAEERRREFLARGWSNVKLDDDDS